MAACVLSFSIYSPQGRHDDLPSPCMCAGPLTARLEHMSRIESREAKQLMQGRLGGFNGGSDDDDDITADLMESPLTFDFERLQQVSSSRFA